MFIIRLFFAVIFVVSGVYHFAKPEFYLPLMPDFLPWHKPLIYLSGLLEIAVGIGLYLPAAQTYAAWGVIGLLVLFTPVHIVDYFRDRPTVGSKPVAAGRLVLQFIFIAIAFYL